MLSTTTDRKPKLFRARQLQLHSLADNSFGSCGDSVEVRLPELGVKKFGIDLGRWRSGFLDYTASASNGHAADRSHIGCAKKARQACSAWRNQSSSASRKVRRRFRSNMFFKSAARRCVIPDEPLAPETAGKLMRAARGDFAGVAEIWFRRRALHTGREENS